MYLYMIIVIILKMVNLCNMDLYECMSEIGDYKVATSFNLYGNTYQSSKYYTGPIRIHYHYDKSFLNIRHNEYIIKEIIPMVNKRLKSLFHVKYGLKFGNLTLRLTCFKETVINGNQLKCPYGCIETCASIKMPSKYLKSCDKGKGNVNKNGEGVAETDYIVVIYSDRYKCGYETAAGSTTCFQNDFNAPVGGVINICPYIINANINQIVLRDLLLHQFIHLLGFSQMLFLSARDDNGNAKCSREGAFTLGYLPESTCYKPVEKVYRKYNYLGNYRDDKKIVFDNIIKDFLENCFKCSSVRLTFQVEEDFHHLDEMLFGNEIMTILPNPMLDKITLITLKFMQSLGWYNMQFHEADNYDYLEFSNCNFVQYGIIEFIKSHKGVAKPPYCTVPYKAGKVFSCHGYFYYEYCDLIDTSLTDERYRYFRELRGVRYPMALRWSGSRSFMNKYPTLQALYSNNQQSSFCRDLHSRHKPRNDNFLESYYGNDSQCFNHDFEYHKNDFYGAACHKVESHNDTAFKIYYKRQSYICPYSKIIKIPVNSDLVFIDCGDQKIPSRTTEESKNNNKKRTTNAIKTLLPNSHSTKNTLSCTINPTFYIINTIEIFTIKLLVDYLIYV